MNLKKLNDLYFSQGNVCVDGLRGRGKDMLMANIIYRKNEPYISNIDYKCRDKVKRGNVHIPLDLNAIDVHNNFKNLNNGNIIPYDYPYPEDCDIYISDCQLYFPTQYCNELDKLYPNFPNFFSLSRQLGRSNIHINTQTIGRVWQKLKEQSDFYLKCNSCRVLGNLVFQTVTIYNKIQSCIDCVEPFKPLTVPIFAKSETKAQFKVKNEELLRNFKQTYGDVKRYTLIYFNKSNYDTRLFKSLLKGGDKIEIKIQDCC